jgi:hypothetical protein
VADFDQWMVDTGQMPVYLAIEQVGVFALVFTNAPGSMRAPRQGPTSSVTHHLATELGRRAHT